MTIPEISALPAEDAEQLHLRDEMAHKADYDAIHSVEFATRCEHQPEEASR